MNEKYMLDINDIKNVVTGDGNRIGFELTLLTPYYRGVALSMIDDLYVKVGDELFPKETLLFTVDGNTYSWPMIETVTTLRWEYGRKATIFVPLDGGLTVAPIRQLEVGCAIRMSYGGGPRPTVVRASVDPCKVGKTVYSERRR